MDFIKRRWPVLLIILIVFVIFGVLFYFNYIESVKPSQNINDFNSDTNQFRPPPNRFFGGIYIFGIMGFFGILAGALIYYFLSEKLLKTKTVQKKNTKIILNFLSREEKLIIETLMKNSGEVYQYELNRIEGVSKVKAHRILKNLEDKEIIIKKNFGKVNKVVLNKELYEVLTKQ